MIEAIVILERTTYEPEDPEDPDSMEAFMLDEWHVVAVQDVAAKHSTRTQAADTVRWEVTENVRVLWGDEVPEGLTGVAGKILVRGMMRWDSWYSYAEHCDESEAVFDIAELRMLALNKPRPEER